MRFNWKLLGLATAAATLLFASGCSGLNASQSVSPLMFLVPGLGQTAPAGTPAAGLPPTPPQPFAQAR